MLKVCQVNNFETEIMLNILVITIDYLPSTGGSYRVLHESIKRQNNMSITLLTSTHLSAAEFDNKQNYLIKRSKMLSLLSRVERPKILKYVIYPIFVLYIVLKEVMKGKYNVLVWGQSVPPYGWLAHITKFVSKKPYTIFVYGEGITSLTLQTHIKYKPVMYMLKKGLQSADRIIANSKATTKRVLSLGIPENLITIIYPGVDSELFKPNIDVIELKKKYNLIGKKILLSVGRLIERKGFDRVIEALPLIIKEFADIVYLIKGEGPYKKEFECLVREYYLNDKVIFLDDVPYEELPRIYNAADIFLMPNRLGEISKEQEGFGIVLLEANCCGVPVIGGRSGGAQEAIEDGLTGFLVDGTKKEEIAKKVLFLLHYPEVGNKMGKAGRERAQKQFSYDNIAKKFAATLENMVKN